MCTGIYTLYIAIHNGKVLTAIGAIRLFTVHQNLMNLHFQFARLISFQHELAINTHTHSYRRAHTYTGRHQNYSICWQDNAPYRQRERGNRIYLYFASCSWTFELDEAYLASGNCEEYSYN